MIICPYCTTSNRDGSNYCNECGRPLNRAVAPPLIPDGYPETIDEAEAITPHEVSSVAPQASPPAASPLPAARPHQAPAPANPLGPAPAPPRPSSPPPQYGCGLTLALAVAVAFFHALNRL